MKKSSFVILLILVFQVFTSYAQDFNSLSNIPLKARPDYKNAEPQVLQCANFLMNMPCKQYMDNIQSVKSLEFLIKWMSGTDNYTFKIGPAITSMSTKDKDLLTLYLAAACKYAIENSANSPGESDIEYNAILLLLQYTENPAFEVKKSKAMKNLIAERDKGTLKDYIAGLK